jgi:hypothetical protein
MGMLDDLEKMMMLQQMEGQQQNQGYDAFAQQAQSMQPQMPNMMQGSPLEKGSMMAVQSARQSIADKKRMLEMDDTERQRALGRAVLAMRDSMNNNPSYGTGTMANIAAMLSGAADGMMSYNQEGERIANANNDLLTQQKEEERLARLEEFQMKKMSHAMEMDNKRLGIEQAEFNLKKQKRDEERKELEILDKAGAEIPISILRRHPSEWTYAQKYLDESAKELKGSKSAITAIDEASEILERNPGITKHWGIILSAAQQDDPTLVKKKLLKLVNESDLKDAQVLSKNLSKLYTSEAGGFGAKAMNKYWEKEIKKGVATPDLLASTTLHLFKDIRKNSVDSYKNNFEVQDAFHNRNSFKRAKPTSLDYDPEETTKYGNKSFEDQGNNSPLSQLTPEQAEARKAQIREQLGQ